MIQKLFFILMISCSLFSACSEEGATLGYVPGEDALEPGKALLTISLTLPQVAETRSQTNGEGATGNTENALDEECRVTHAWVILGELATGQQAPIKISQAYFVEKFQYAGNPAQWCATIPCTPGHYRVALVVNPGKLFHPESLLLSKNWDDLARYVVTCRTYEELAQTWASDQFLMTNAYRGSFDDNDVMLIAGEHTYKDLYVQRTCARFDYQVKEQDNRYVMDCRVDGQDVIKLPVVLNRAALMNVSNNFNLFKMVVPDNQSGRVPNFYQYETHENYVYDSDWTAKRIFHATPIFEDKRLKEFFFFSSEGNVADATPSVSLTYQELPGALNQKDFTLAYASENTLPGVLAQINKLSTGVVFQGSFQLPDHYASVQEVYYRSLRAGNELYTSWEALKKQLQAEGHHLPDGVSDAQLAQLEVVKYTRRQGVFPVWYTYWNRHNDNLRPQEMGVMEFAVVRNNVYKLRVNSISSLGLPLAPDNPDNPWRPDGNTPDEQLPQIDVSVEVCDWVTRELVHNI